MLFPGKKLVYFVRHGQSANNAANVRQGSKGGLSDKGKKQAEFVGERLEHAGIEAVFASTYDRAKETATIINYRLRCPIEFFDFLSERKNPSEIVGKDAEAPEVKRIMDMVDRSFHDSSFRYSDEENFEDLRARAGKVLDFLSKRTERRILCVSHRIFLKMLFAYVNEGINIDPHGFVFLDYHTKVENTAITIVEYNVWKKLVGKNPWRILAVNDYGRLDPTPSSVL